jgi:hypothetical protein
MNSNDIVLVKLLRNRGSEPDAYSRDDWRVNRGLALNLGARYEIFTVPAEFHSSYANFDDLRNL